MQNTAGAPTNVSLQVYNGSTIIYSAASAVPAYGYVTFDQTQLGQNGAFSARISASTNLAALVTIWTTGGTQLYQYNALPSGGQFAYAPVIMKHYSADHFSTTVTVQNTGNAVTNISVTYSNNWTHVFSNLAPGASALFYTPNETGLPDGGIYSAVVQSDSQPIVALVNESSDKLRAASYRALRAGGLGADAPIIMKEYSGYSTSITCENIGGAATDITVSYAGYPGAQEVMRAVPVWGTALFYQPNNAGLPAGYNGSAMITSSGSPIVCIVNENQVNNPSYQDWLLAYEALVQ